MNTFRLLVTRLREVRRAAGSLRALLITPLWLIRRRFLILEMDITPATAESALTETRRFEWQQLDQDELPSLVQVNPAVHPDLIARRLREGNLCYVCRIDGQIVHYRWYASQPAWLPFLGITWQPEEGDYTVLGAYTRPEFRNRGVNEALVQRGFERARELGFRRVVSFIAYWNAPSLRGTTRAGLRATGAVTFWNFGIIRWHSASGSARVSKGALRMSRRGAV